ncbi:MAG: holliday junction helicase RuvA [Bacteroidales bacterium]|nr:holliday junction helicase RuvA [Bacteroidales bacterium]
MYAYLDGRITGINPAFVIIDCNGVGYEVNISLNTFAAIKDMERVKLYTHLEVKEDAHVLYGFWEEEERTLFRQLISVAGIGPNTARMILSAMTTAELISAIATGNENRLKQVKGIGAKSAQRILIELKDKVSKIPVQSSLLTPSNNRNYEEALSGLVILGFSKPMAAKALDRIVASGGQNLSVEALIKEALKVL